MDANALPYYVQAQIAAKGYYSVEDVADLYDSPALARANGPAEWEFLTRAYGWTSDEERFAGIKLYQAIRQRHGDLSWGRS